MDFLHFCNACALSKKQALFEIQLIVEQSFPVTSLQITTDTVLHTDNLYKYAGTLLCLL